MKLRTYFSIALVLTAGLVGCRSEQPDYCTVTGTVKNIKDGTRLELQDAFDNFKVVGTCVVRNGAFEIHPKVTSPTHVYLYPARYGEQLKDFILEPGTIRLEVDPSDPVDYATGAAGTPSNEVFRQYLSYWNAGEFAAADSVRRAILDAEELGALGLRFAVEEDPASKALACLDRLSPEIAAAKEEFVRASREELERRIKTEPQGDGVAPEYIDMTYPDIDGQPVSLSSVVNDPANRYVLLDFWGTWCNPCREAVPVLAEVYGKYHAKGLEIYSVALQPNKEAWKEFVEENGMTWINAFTGSGSREGIWSTYALSGIPTMILIDCRTGGIIARDNHLPLDELLEPLLR